jgi:hypothetical protein
MEHQLAPTENMMEVKERMSPIKARPVSMSAVRDEMS